MAPDKKPGKRKSVFGAGFSTIGKVVTRKPTYSKKSKKKK